MKRYSWYLLLIMNLLFPSDWEFIESQLVKYGIEWKGAEQNVIADKERQRVRIENDIYQSINSILHPENFIINVELSIIISSLHDSTDVVTEIKEDGSIHIQNKKGYGRYLPCIISNPLTFTSNGFTLLTSFAPKVILQTESSISSDIIRANINELIVEILNQHEGYGNLFSECTNILEFESVNIMN